MERSKRVAIPSKKYMDSENLIRQVQKYPALWDETLPDYQDRGKRRTLWNNIAKEFVGASPNDFRKEWASLRRALANKRNLYAKSHGRSGSAAVPYKPYKYEHLMLFVDGVRGDDRMEGNLEDTPRVDDISKENEEEYVNSDNTMETDNTMEADNTMETDDVEEQQNRWGAEEIDRSMNARDWSMRMEEVIANEKENRYGSFDENLENGVNIPKLNYSKIAASTPLSPAVKRTPLRPLQFNQCDSPLKKRLSTIPENADPIIIPLKRKTDSQQPPHNSPIVVRKMQGCSQPSQKLAKIESPRAKRLRLKMEKQAAFEKKREDVVKELEFQVQKFSDMQESEGEAMKQQSNREIRNEIKKGCCSSVLEEALVKELNRSEDPLVMFLVSLADGLRGLSKATYRDFQMAVLTLVKEYETESAQPSTVNVRAANVDERFLLSADSEQVLRTALNMSEDTLAVIISNLYIKGCDLHTLLKPNNWLNDMIINAYLKLIHIRGKQDVNLSVYAFCTFFITKMETDGYDFVSSWGNEDNVLEHDLILVPVHLGAHWSLIVVNVASKVLTYYDSMAGSSKKTNLLINYLTRKSGESGWVEGPKPVIPRQMNSVDCGVYLCMFANYVSLEKSIDFDDKDMPKLRNRIAYEICQGCLLN